MDRIVAYGLVVVTLAVCGPAVAGAQQAPAARPASRPPAKPAAPKPAAASVTKAPGKFDAIAAEAAKAREAKQLDRAVVLYRQGLALRPSWNEGQWGLGTSLYELERFAEARDAFRKVVTADPQNGTAWALKGLCEFRLKEFDAALTDLLEARKLPITGGRDVLDVARYHAGILLTRAGQFDQALMILNDFGTQGNESPGVIEAMGLAVLRMPILPADLPGPRRDLVLLAGRARYFQAARLMSAARNAFELLVSRYPDTPNVHYAYGVFLLAEETDKALQVFERELKVSPQNTYAKLQIAFALIRQGEYDKALPWAKQGAEEAPTDYVARHAYGQALLESGDVPAAIRELEAGAKLAPDSPIVHFILAKAYRRAGRTADADKSQQEFLRLNKLFREARTGTESVGGIPIDSEPGVRNP
jgi:tetratricopeptide (TPR) repeat protein